MNELHVFVGDGGGVLGGKLNGHTTVGGVEIEHSCRSKLIQRMRDGALPWFPIWDDVTTFDGRPWRGLVDILCGGFPCQDISSAGHGAGAIDGERSVLWTQMLRIASEMECPYMFMENSTMLVDRGLYYILGAITEMGYHVRWGVWSSADLGACHRRERLWLLAFDPNRVLELDRIKNTQFSQKPRSCAREFARAISTCIPIGSIPTDIRIDAWMARGVERFKSTGNGQDARVAAYAWRRLSENLTYRPLVASVHSHTQLNEVRS